MKGERIIKILNANYHFGRMEDAIFLTAMSLVRQNSTQNFQDNDTLIDFNIVNCRTKISITHIGMLSFHSWFP